jgi:hypothetical protein
MRGLFVWTMKFAPSGLLIVAIVNFIVGLFTTLAQPIDPYAAIAASLNAGLLPFIAAAVLYRTDLYLAALCQTEQSDRNA